MLLLATPIFVAVASCFITSRETQISGLEHIANSFFFLQIFNNSVNYRATVYVPHSRIWSTSPSNSIVEHLSMSVQSPCIIRRTMTMTRMLGNSLLLFLDGQQRRRSAVVCAAAISTFSCASGLLLRVRSDELMASRVDDAQVFTTISRYRVRLHGMVNATTAC